MLLVHAWLGRGATAATCGLALLVSLPGTVMAECNGPACGPTETGVEGLQATLLAAILGLFGTIMAIAEVRRR